MPKNRGPDGGGGGQGGCEPRIEGILKMQKKLGGWGEGGDRGWEGRGGYELRINYCENAIKVGAGGSGRGGGEVKVIEGYCENVSINVRGGSGWGDQCGCEPRIEVIVKMPKKSGDGEYGR